MRLKFAFIVLLMSLSSAAQATELVAAMFAACAAYMATPEVAQQQFDEKVQSGIDFFLRRSRLPQLKPWSGYEAGPYFGYFPPELEYVEAYLKDPSKFWDKKLAPPHVLLAGIPGCGKTSLVEALADRHGAMLIKTSIGQLKDMYIGQSEKNVAALFDRAERAADLFYKRNKKGLILFIDEIDGVGQRIDNPGTPHANFINDFIATFLVKIGAATGRALIIGATNRPYNLDSGLVRPGRLKIIHVPSYIPDDKMNEVVARYSEHLKLDFEDSSAIAKLLKGKNLTGAEIREYLGEVAENAMIHPLVENEKIDQRASHLIADKLRGVGGVSAVQMQQLAPLFLTWWQQQQASLQESYE